MEVKSTTEEIQTKWYNHLDFSLIPIFERKLGDQFNTPGFSFRWLFFKFWSLDACEFELAFVIGGHWGIGIIGLLPYLRFVIHIPFSYKFQFWLQKKLWRKPEKAKNPIDEHNEMFGYDN